MRSIGGSGVRSSVRSRGSSSTSASDPREKVKDCCRKLVAFMCTQVGVGGLVVGYAFVGAFGFISLEGDWENPQDAVVELLQYNCSTDLWDLTTRENTFNETAWRIKADQVLKKFQSGIATAAKNGYNGLSAKDMWSFPAALMFCLAIFTMIGYGNMVPRTPWGKGVTVLYAVFGIPLYVLYFMNMGEVLATTFRWLYRRLYDCSNESRGEQDAEGSLPPTRIIVPSTACLWVIGGYVLTGTIMFAEWEGWEYLDSSYFCVTSLCKIGIGDFVPGANILEYRDGSQTKLIINFVYLLLGMGLVAMCYNLMREDVREKMRELREDCSQWLEDIRVRSLACYGRNNGE